MWTVQRNVGRLFEARIESLQTREQVSAFGDECRRLMKRAGQPVVVCADYRAVHVFSPVAAEALKELLRDLNPLIERSGLLVAPDHAINLMQMSRVARESGTQRRTFVDKAPLREWLDEVLTPAEQARLTQFLG